MWHDDRFRSFDRLDPLTEMDAELGIRLERVTGIEPAFSAWEADVLPLNYTRSAGLPRSRRARRGAGKTSGRSAPSSLANEFDLLSASVGHFSNFSSRWSRWLPIPMGAFTSCAPCDRSHIGRGRPALAREHQPVVRSDTAPTEPDPRRAPQRLGQLRLLVRGRARRDARGRSDAGAGVVPARPARLTSPTARIEREARWGRSSAPNRENRLH